MAGTKGRSGRKSGPKTINDLFKVYEAEYARVQPSYRKFVTKLTLPQFVQEFNAQEESEKFTKAGTIKQTTGIKFARNLVRHSYTWTQNRIRAAYTNINEYIKDAWLTGMGRTSTQGRLPANAHLDVNRVTQNQGQYSLINSELIRVMIQDKGDGQALSTYIMTENDIISESQYYKDVTNVLLNYLGGDDVYGS